MKQDTLPASAETAQPQGFSRRKFLSVAGLGLAGATLTASCKKDNPVLDGQDVDLGGGDTGILNYAYALEQIEAAFYSSVMYNMYVGMTAAEQQMLNDIKMHEIAHREFLKNALGSKAIPALTIRFDGIDFSSRDSVLGAAKAFEDLGVAAYNGAGKLIEDVNYLLLAGKIVSVEARHAAYIRDLISNGSFADNTVIDSNGMEMSKPPAEVLSIAGKFIKDRISANNLPTD
ncbi:ferritin-like domain-containing protein [Taibaiella koreensis]|uniref:ferritin-like domain-containing protein n=1 Tax=Taibaiella koreensis TaxID=1268548 RepID=UPI001F093455|nr:ferritin-like domain-containing protein [Taibaiella koreensis]